MLPAFLLQPAEGRRESEGTCCAGVLSRCSAAEGGAALEVGSGGGGVGGCLSPDMRCGAFGSSCYREAASSLP